MAKNKESVSFSGSFDFWDKLNYLFSNPNLFFEKIKLEKGMKNAILTFAIVGVFVDVVSYGARFIMPYGMGLFGLGYLGLGYFGIFRYGFLSIFPFVGFLIALLISFIYSGIIHAIVIAFKGSGTFSETYKAYAYSMIPFLIIKLIPILGYLSIIYSFILMIIGVSKLHNISRGKAALACLLPVILVIGIFVFFIFMYLSLFFRGF